MRTSQDGASGEVQRSNCLRSGNGRKLVQESIERLSALQIVEQRLCWHSRAGKNRRAAENFRVTVNNLKVIRHGDSWSL